MFTQDWTFELTICYREKQIGASFTCISPVIDDEFQHNIVKVVCISKVNIMRKLVINKKTDT